MGPASSCAPETSTYSEQATMRPDWWSSIPVPAARLAAPNPRRVTRRAQAISGTANRPRGLWDERDSHGARWQPGIQQLQLFGTLGAGEDHAAQSRAKLHKMCSGDYAPEFPLEWALKDVDLALATAGQLPLLEALSRQWHAAVDAGHGRQDVSAARLALGSPR